MVQVRVFLKEGGWYFYLIFSRFIIFKFRNYFILCEIVLCVALCSTITYKLRYISLIVNGFKRLKIDF